MISIIIVGRNDDYGRNFAGRLFSTLDYNTQKLEQIGCVYEIIFVEWNPLEGRPLLSYKIVERFKKSFCYVVDNSIHRYVAGNKYIDVYEYHAKNIGAKQAKGDWLMITNPDVFLGKKIIDFLASGNFDNQTLYRAGWVNIKNEADIDDQDLEDSYKDDIPPYNCASGDFIFVKKSLFDLMGGYREDFNFTEHHKDSILCLTIFAQTKKVYKIGNIYHFDHDRSHNFKRIINYAFWRVPRIHQTSYGHADIAYAQKISDRIYKLKLNEELNNKIKFKVIPYPRCPFKYNLLAQTFVRRLKKLCACAFHKNSAFV
jgi:hypothetical protein